MASSKGKDSAITQKALNFQIRESYKAARTNIDYSIIKKGCKKIAFTSSAKAGIQHIELICKPQVSFLFTNCLKLECTNSGISVVYIVNGSKERRNALWISSVQPTPMSAMLTR